MPTNRKSGHKVAKGRARASFTLVELLTVIGIIAILAALILTAGNGVMAKAKRSRASAEIQAMSTALESYKADNGIYPPSDNVLAPNYSTFDPTSSTTNSTLLYMAITGQTNYNNGASTGVKSYMSLKANQVGNLAGPYSYVKDPWNYAYGYSTGSSAANPYNGTNFFDLFSTGGQKMGGNTNAWISNWQ
jgi:type II secretory pathway pseudopilin PulG